MTEQPILWVESGPLRPFLLFVWLIGDLYTEAAESATQQTDGRLAAKYFELADEAYAKAGEGCE